MTEAALIELRKVREIVSILVANLTPWIGMDEMKARYGCTGQTLLAMERKKKIPERVNGRWLRSEVVKRESAS